MTYTRGKYIFIKNGASQVVILRARAGVLFIMCRVVLILTERLFDIFLAYVRIFAYLCGRFNLFLLAHEKEQAK